MVIYPKSSKIKVPIDYVIFDVLDSGNGNEDENYNNNYKKNDRVHQLNHHNKKTLPSFFYFDVFENDYNDIKLSEKKFCLTADCNWTQDANNRNQNGHFQGPKSKPTLRVLYGFTCLCIRSREAPKTKR